MSNFGRLVVRERHFLLANRTLVLSKPDRHHAAGRCHSLPGGGECSHSHPDEEFGSRLVERHFQHGSWSVNWAGFVDQQQQPVWWSQPTCQFSPWTLSTFVFERLYWFNRPLGNIAQITRANRYLAVILASLNIFLIGLVMREYWHVRTYSSNLADSDNSNDGSVRSDNSRIAQLLGVLASFVLALTFLHVHDTSYGRVEALLSLLITIIMWLYVRFDQQPSLSQLACIGVPLGVLIAAKYNAGFWSVIIALFGLVRYLKVQTEISALTPGDLSKPRRQVSMLHSVSVYSIVLVGVSLICFCLAIPELFSDWRPFWQGIVLELNHYSGGHIPHEAMNASDFNLRFYLVYLAWLGMGVMPLLGSVVFLVYATFGGQRLDRFVLTIVAIGMLTICLPRVRFERNLELLLVPAIFASVIGIYGMCRVIARGNTRLMVGLLIVCPVIFMAQSMLAVTRYLDHAINATKRMEVFRDFEQLKPEYCVQNHHPSEYALDLADHVALVDYGDPFSRAYIPVWEPVLKPFRVVGVYESAWRRYGYPFSTVDVYCGPSRLVMLTRREPLPEPANMP